jgi:KipI family sensor histidine kinase inhibitor
MKTQPITYARYLPFGDSALLVEFGNTINAEINRRVILLNDAVVRVKVVGVEELVPTYRSLLIRYDPATITYELLTERIAEVEKNLARSTKKAEGKRIVVPVVYGGDYGPDLGYVAEYHGLTEEQAINAHSDRDYRVYMLGFIAGFPYLGDVADEIATPRHETPRLKVAAGSVGIAEKQTGIYPSEAPGGWQIIGRTPLKLFSPDEMPPTLVQPGDIVRFKPILESEFKATVERRMCLPER